MALPGHPRWSDGRPLRRAVAVVAGAALLSIAPAAAADAVRLTVFERMARADLVIRARTLDGAMRFADCEVLEVVRGAYPSQRIQIAFRLDNMLRPNWDDRIVFDDGVESILLLAPAIDAAGAPLGPDKFSLVGGFFGKIDLPPEGAEAHIQAFRKMGEILGLTDIHAAWEAYRALLGETNPYLIETGFHEVLKFRLGNQAMVPVLLGHLESRHDAFRGDALGVLAQIFESGKRRGTRLDNEDHVVARILTAAITDDNPDVRVRAVRALQAFGRPEILPPLREVAKDDPSQHVRYQASLSLYQLGHGGPPAAEAPQTPPPTR